MHRFPNGAEESDGHLRWNLSELYEQVLVGLQKLGERYPQVSSLGIDTWAVDYALLDSDGALLAEPIAYRDGRTEAVVDDVHARVDPGRLYAINGLQFLPFNTIYQLAAEQRGPLWRTRSACRPVAGPAGVLADRAAAQRNHERLDDRAAGRLFPIVVERGAGRARDPGRPVPAADRTRRGRRHAPIGGGHPDRSRTGRAGDRSRLPRHRVRRGRRARRGPRLRVRVVGHLVAGRPGAGRAGAQRREPRGELHQRRGSRRTRALPPQRGRPLAPAGVAADVAGGWGRSRPGHAADRGRWPASRWPDRRRRRRRVPPAGGHAQPDPRRLRGERAGAAAILRPPWSGASSTRSRWRTRGPYGRPNGSPDRPRP